MPDPKRKIFRVRGDRVYIAFNKPFGTLSQFTPPENAPGKRTLSEFGFPAGVYPVGRLDEDSEGLLLLSDDGALNELLLDPKFGHERTYHAQVENVPSEEALRGLRQGVMARGRMTLPAKAMLLATTPDLPPRNPPIRYRANIPTSWLSLTLTEGRNRQVRRMTAAIGHPTLRLVRVAIGELRLSDLALAEGKWRRLRPEELSSAILIEKV